MPAKKFNSVTIDPAKAKPTRRYGQYNNGVPSYALPPYKETTGFIRESSSLVERKSKLKVIYA